MKQLIEKYISTLNLLRDLPPLVFRLTLAFGFYGPAMKKWEDINAVGTWFAKMNYPFPHLNAYMAAGTETVGFVLLALGLATRFITLPLMFVMVIAITTVHLNNGFECSKNGFEIPFYYLVMLFSLLVTGAGKFSVDALIARSTKA